MIIHNCNNSTLNEKPTTYLSTISTYLHMYLKQTFQCQRIQKIKTLTYVRHLKSIKETSEKLSPPCKGHSKATTVKHLHFNHLIKMNTDL